MAEARWTGCLGVRLAPADAAAPYGWGSGTPLLDATLGEGAVGEAGPVEVWHLRGSEGGETYDQRLTRHDDGRLTLHTLTGALAVHPAASAVTIEAPTVQLARQFVTTYAIPLLLHDVAALGLHACAATPPGSDRATVVCGPSGAGKSSLLVAMVDAGWTPVAEDICVVDDRGAHAVVWPGAPWVRTAGPGPLGAERAFTTADKTAWDLGPWAISRPVAVERLVFLQHPGGERPSTVEVDTAGAIARLAARTVWLTEPYRRAPATFPHLVRLARTVPAVDLRLPRAAGWTDLALDVLVQVQEVPVRQAAGGRRTPRRSVTYDARKGGGSD